MPYFGHITIRPLRRHGQDLQADETREMRRVTLTAFGNAKLAGRGELQPEDVRDGRARKARIGF